MTRFTEVHHQAWIAADLPLLQAQVRKELRAAVAEESTTWRFGGTCRGSRPGR